MYVKDQRIFGPKSNLSNFRGNPLQFGQRIGSWLGKLARGVGTIAKKGVKIGKKIAKSDFAREVGTSLMDHGVHAATEILSNAIDPNKESNALEEAQSGVNAARSDLAKIIKQKNFRKRKNKTINEDISDSEEKL